MPDKNFDQLLKDYRQTIDAWVDAIRAEEALANDDHSMVEMEKWDAAGFTVHDTEAAAKKARDQYKNALRKKNYGF
jgi:TRAP-type C4-dicarboxylate transport system substrate-binding protein